MRHHRRARNVTTAEVSRRLDAIGYPIADTGITKAEKGDRRVDVDDLAPIALVLGVTPNTLLMPQVDYLGTADTRQLTPKVEGSAERLWQWAQGEKPLRVPVPGAPSWLGDSENLALEFSIRCRPYLTALHAPAPGAVAPGVPHPALVDLTAAVLAALGAGAGGTEVRRAVELAITLPAIMSPDEISRWLKDGTRPDEEGS